MYPNVVYVALCPGAGVENFSDRMVDHHTTDGSAPVGQVAKNLAAFEVIKETLVDGNPILTRMLSSVSMHTGTHIFVTGLYMYRFRRPNIGVVIKLMSN